MKKYFHALFACCFFLACCLPAAGMAVLGPSGPGSNEILAGPPQPVTPEGQPNLRFLSDAAEYFSDHFAFRQELITADARLKAQVFATSAQPDVALGQEGWLFYGETIDDYTGADTMSPRQVYCVASALRQAQDYVLGKGRGFTFTIAPNKISLYPEKYHPKIQRAPATAADLVQDCLNEYVVSYTDLFQPIGAYEDCLYRQLDSHWTNQGAALAHDLLLDSLGLPGEKAMEKPGRLETRCLKGDLYDMLYPAAQETLDSQFCFDQALDFQYTTPIRGEDDLRIETSSDGENAPLLMFRDSFGNALHSLMAESFSKALFSRAMPYNLGLMEEISAQYVVVEIVERNLPLLAQAPFLMPAPQAEAPEYSLAEEKAGGTAGPGGNLRGYQKIEGRVEAACDWDSPIYLKIGAEAFQAMPTSNGDGQAAFTAYVPDSLELEGAEVIYRQNGQWLGSPWTAKSTEKA